MCHQINSTSESVKKIETIEQTNNNKPHITREQQQNIIKNFHDDNIPFITQDQRQNILRELQLRNVNNRYNDL